MFDRNDGNMTYSVAIEGIEAILDQTCGEIADDYSLIEPSEY